MKELGLERCPGTVRYDRERSRQTAVDGVCDTCARQYVHIFGQWTPMPDDGPDPELLGNPSP
jgi:hypothetical protein